MFNHLVQEAAMKVTLQEFGGLAAGMRRMPHTVDSEALAKPAAEELARLVAAAAAAPLADQGPGPVRDAMGYTITVDDGGQPTVLEQSDGNMSPAFAALLNWLRQYR
jgi:hypothetical protein